MKRWRPLSLADIHQIARDGVYGLTYVGLGSPEPRVVVAVDTGIRLIQFEGGDIESYDNRVARSALEVTAGPSVVRRDLFREQMAQWRESDARSRAILEEQRAALAAMRPAARMADHPVVCRGLP